MEPLHFVGLAFWVAMFFVGMLIARNRMAERDRANAFNDGQDFYRRVLASQLSEIAKELRVEMDSKIETATVEYLQRRLSLSMAPRAGELMQQISLFKPVPDTKPLPMYTESTVTATKKTKKRKASKKKGK